jgi:hypothetical protein
MYMEYVLEDDLVYVISIDEIMWGGVLLAITMAFHGIGMLLTLRVSNYVKQRFEPYNSLVLGLGTLILASWMIIVVNLLEIGVWSSFFVWKDAMSNASRAFYYALANYTTLNSGYLPRRWRLLEGMLAMAGLLTCAWSTGVLFMLVQEFQEVQLKRLKKRRGRQESGPAPSATERPGTSA